MRGRRTFTAVATAWLLRSKRAVTCAAAMGALGCGDETTLVDGTVPSMEPDAGNTGGADGSTAPTLSVAWEPCLAHAGDNEIDAFCATLQMPLFHAEAEGESIDFFVKRLPAAEEPQLQLWLLQGGPGSSGETLEYLAWQIQQTLPNIEVLIPDHRGAGRSTFFECPETYGMFSDGGINFQAFVQRCPLELADIWGQGTAAFNTTEAARDVALTIKATRRESVPVAGYGVSYGGYCVKARPD